MAKEPDYQRWLIPTGENEFDYILTIAWTARTRGLPAALLKIAKDILHRIIDDPLDLLSVIETGIVEGWKEGSKNGWKAGVMKGCKAGLAKLVENIAGLLTEKGITWCLTYFAIGGALGPLGPFACALAAKVVGKIVRQAFSWLFGAKTDPWVLFVDVLVETLPILREYAEVLKKEGLFHALITSVHSTTILSMVHSAPSSQLCM